MWKRKLDRFNFMQFCQTNIFARLFLLRAGACEYIEQSKKIKI